MFVLFFYCIVFIPTVFHTGRFGISVSHLRRSDVLQRLSVLRLDDSDDTPSRHDDPGRHLLSVRVGGADRGIVHEFGA